jgi:hypothetical protein
MTKTAVYELVSNFPAQYGTVKTQIDIPWNCRRVRYWVDSVNTFANTNLLTVDDWIELEYRYIPDDVQYTISYANLQNPDTEAYICAGIYSENEDDSFVIAELFGIDVSENNPWATLGTHGTWTIDGTGSGSDFYNFSKLWFNGVFWQEALASEKPLTDGVHNVSWSYHHPKLISHSIGLLQPVPF